MTEPNDLETHRAVVADIRADISDYRREWVANVKAVREDIAGIRHLVSGSAETFDNGFAEMRERLAEASAAQQHIIELVTILVEKQRDK